MNNPALNAGKGDTAPQNYAAFITPLGGSHWESLYPFQYSPTNQDVCNAMAQEGKNPLEYTWKVFSLHSSMVDVGGH
jgi:hypothetical protein